MKQERMKELDDNTLRRFITGECSEKEYTEINNWLKENEKNVQELFRIEQIYHLGKFDRYNDPKKIDRAEKKLFRRINQEETTQKNNVLYFRRWVQYAAVIAIIIMAGGIFGYWYHTVDTGNNLIVESNPGSTAKEILLPDGSKVWINHATTLTYPKEFDNKERNVYIEGEAYFEVEKDPRKPFVVQSEAMRVKVLGTIFNFKSDPKDRVAEATLIEGEIEVKGNKEEGMITLSPGQRAELNKNNGRLTVRQVDAKLDAVWRNDLIPFEQANIFAITKTLERFYNVKIIISPEVRSDVTYSGVLKRKNTIDSVLESLKNSIPINYKIEGNNIFISSAHK